MQSEYRHHHNNTECHSSVEEHDSVNQTLALSHLEDIPIEWYIFLSFFPSYLAMNSPC